MIQNNKELAIKARFLKGIRGPLKLSANCLMALKLLQLTLKGIQFLKAE